MTESSAATAGNVVPVHSAKVSPVCMLSALPACVRSAGMIRISSRLRLGSKVQLKSKVPQYFFHRIFTQTLSEPAMMNGLTPSPTSDASPLSPKPQPKMETSTVPPIWIDPPICLGRRLNCADTSRYALSSALSGPHFFFRLYEAPAPARMPELESIR